MLLGKRNSAESSPAGEMGTQKPLKVHSPPPTKPKENLFLREKRGKGRFRSIGCLKLVGKSSKKLTKGVSLQPGGERDPKKNEQGAAAFGEKTGWESP